MNKIYFDNAATTEMSDKVISVIMDTMKNNYGNPSSTHSFGRNSKSILELSRKFIAEKLNAKTSEIIFTSGGTESNNMIIKSVVEAQNIERIITTKIEHKAVLNSIESISKTKKISVEYLEVDNCGNPNIEQLKNSLEKSDQMTLVSLMHINNEIGTIINLNEYGEICRSNNALFHSDTVQTIGHYDLDLSATTIDFITCSAHKFHGPKGVGFAYINNETIINPFIEGGSQERGYRGGTESIHNILGLKTAFEISYESLEKDSKKVSKIKEYFIHSILKNIPGTKINGNSDTHNSSYTILNLCLPIPKEKKTVLDFKLDLAGIACSSGSACQSGSSKPSHVLSEILSNSEMEKISLRFSFSKFNSLEEVDYVVTFLKDFINDN
ncbi:MAG: cysteine desulfurase [bacterium TMED250]|nr:MAG: cysteine desulfurase [bacterium TMED250]|tara:strand:- start:1328 stop:2476 length:1149 start_codon:yes stop_codon:yes gene_type:complete